MGFLDKVRAYKLEEVEGLNPEDFGDRRRPVLNPLEYISSRPVIAEVKRASPTAGVIRLSDPVEQALLYQKGGAGAVSVLVDERFFRGSWSYLKDVASEVEIPVLCKEFILSEKQIEVAYRCGADFVLLIYGFVERDRLVELMRFASAMGLGVLLEVFAPEHLEEALSVDVPMIGVNSRNLQDLSVDLGRGRRMLSRIPGGRFKVAESGMRSLDDVRLMVEAGASAFLIGEMLMRAEDPVSLLEEINGLCEGVRREGP